MEPDDIPEESKLLLKKISKEREMHVNEFFEDQLGQPEDYMENRRASILDKEEIFFFKERSKTQRNNELPSLHILSLNSKDSFKDLLKEKQWNAIFRKIFKLGKNFLQKKDAFLKSGV